MGVGLVPLEFTECLADSPHFRENLLRHEKELDRTSQQVKRLIKEVKDVVHAAKRECRCCPASLHPYTLTRLVRFSPCLLSRDLMQTNSDGNFE